jgi:RsiW-degrading membrane proteinase PrsW (M82 family)
MPAVRCPCGLVWDAAPGALHCPRCERELDAPARLPTTADRPLPLLAIALVPLLVYATLQVGHVPTAHPASWGASGSIRVRWAGSQWLWGIGSAGGVGLALGILFRLRRPQAKAVLIVSMFAALLGIALFLLLQAMAVYPWRPGRGRGAALTYLCQFIGFSYRAAIDPQIGFFRAFFSFFLGTGLLEGIVKAAPLLLYLRGRETLNVRDSVLWGLASGAVVGCLEAVSYASTIFPRFSGVTFISSVAVHAVLNGITALIAWKREEDLEAAEKGVEWFFVACIIVAAGVALHACYDTFLKRDLPWGALAVAFASFAIFLTLRKQADRWERRLSSAQA